MVRAVHKYLSLALAALWFFQALTGILLVFQRELDDSTLPQPPQPLDVAAFDDAIEDIKADHPDKTIPYLLAAGPEDRFDVYVVDEEGRSHVIRVDGDGTLLRQRPSNHDLLDAGIFRIAIGLHEELFIGSVGMWVLGASAFFLLTNIILGLKLAWPRRGQWRRVLLPRRVKNMATNLYAWHRALGLWLAVPVIASVTTGLLMAWAPLTAWLGPVAPPPAAIDHVPASQAIAVDHALEAAFTRYPAARLSILEFPQEETPWYKIRLLQPGEPRAVYGTTTVYVGAGDGRILADYDAFEAPPGTDFLNILYPVHNGELLGLPGRIIVLISGLWIIAMIGLGVSLWWSRRRSGRPAG